MLSPTRKCPCSIFDVCALPTYLCIMHEAIRQQLKPGVKVRVTQQIAARGRTWMAEVDGTIVR